MISQRFFAPRRILQLAQRGMAFRKHPRKGDKREVVQKYRAVNGAHEDAAAASGLPWRTVAATYDCRLILLIPVLCIFKKTLSFIRILHRYPTILVSPEDWEVKMFELQEKIGDKRREVSTITIM